MGNGLGDLGFWLAVGIVIAAVIVAGAIKERERQATARESMEATRASKESAEAMRRALLENAGENITEVLAYLRERDAAAAANADRVYAQMRRDKPNPRQGLAFAAAFTVGVCSFIGGLAASETQHHPEIPRFVFSQQAGRLLPVPPPPPTGWDAFAPLGVMLGVWAAGLIIAALILAWGYRKQKNDAQPDA